MCKPVKFQFGIIYWLASKPGNFPSAKCRMSLRVLSMTKCKSEQIGIIPYIWTWFLKFVPCSEFQLLRKYAYFHKFNDYDEIIYLTDLTIKVRNWIKSLIFKHWFFLFFEWKMHYVVKIQFIIDFYLLLNFSNMLAAKEMHANHTLVLAPFLAAHDRISQ